MSQMTDAFNNLRSAAYSTNYSGKASFKQVAVVNNALDKFFPERSGRIEFFRQCFDRKSINSANDLTKAEASALISFMFYDGWNLNPYWEDIIKEFKESR